MARKPPIHVNPGNIRLTLRSFERAALEEALREARGNVRLVPALLEEHHPSPIYRKLASHQLGDVSLCAHGRARIGYADKMDWLEVCSACNAGRTEIMMENRYK